MDIENRRNRCCASSSRCSLDAVIGWTVVAFLSVFALVVVYAVASSMPRVLAELMK